ncbi:MAG: hypothetical protein ABIT37_24865 [Luteolibacter sp.]
MNIPRLHPPPEGQTVTVKGWCLYQNDRWDGPVPHDWDEHGWRVYPDRATAFLGLAREMRNRCDQFDVGQLLGEHLVCTWYPAEVTYLPNGWVRDDTEAEFAPGKPW